MWNKTFSSEIVEGAILSIDQILKIYLRTGSKRDTAKSLNIGKKEFNRLWKDNNMDAILEDYDPDFKVGLVADTHFGRTDQQITALRNLYTLFKARKVDFVIHAGDIIDKKCFQTVRNGVWCKRSIIDWVVDKYPRNGLKTYLIAGNHCKITNRKYRQNLAEIVTSLRNDFTYIGEDSSAIRHSYKEFYIHHANGLGEIDRLHSLYSVAIAEGYDPDVIIAGHLHKWQVHPNINRSIVVQLPSLIGGSECGAAILHVGDVKYIEPLEINILNNDY